MEKIKNILFWILVVILILVGFWLRYDNLGQTNFQSDEFFHLYTAKGYLETSHFVQWDFIKEQPVGKYIRAFPYTWLVAQSFKIFGISEWSGRLPSLIFGILFLPLIYWLSFKITKNKLVALSVLALIVFDSSFIWSSRLCRMYSMFVFFAAITVYLIFKGLEGKNNKLNYYFLSAGGILFIFTYFIHEATLLLGLGFLIYFIFNIKEKRYKVLTLVSLIILIAFFLINFFVTQLTTDNFFIIRADPNWEYFLYPFNQIRLSFFAWLIVLAGFFLFFRSEKIKVYFFSLGLPIVLFFAFFANRYAAKKYLLFIVPFLLIIYADSLYLIIKKVFKKYSSYFFIFVFIVFGSIITIPTAGDVHDYRTAYQYLEQHYQAGEPVLIQGKETYYFTRKDLDLISMKANKKYKFEEFKQVVDNNQSGWVVYPKFKSDHISDKIINYCKENLTSIEEVKETNVKIFHWGS